MAYGNNQHTASISGDSGILLLWAGERGRSGGWLTGQEQLTGQE